MAMEDEILFVKNIVVVDGPFECEDVPTNNYNTENVHMEPNILLENVVCNLLYKFKLYFGNHTTKFQFLGVSFL